MLAQWHKMNAVSNNLANINTQAYKKDHTLFKSFPELLIRRLDDNGIVKLPIGSYDQAPYVGKLGTGVELNEVYTNFQQGNLQKTNNQFDLALNGKGFFVVKMNNSQIYTRNSSFLIDKNGFLVTTQGFKVQGENGDIQIKTHNFQVNPQGEIVQNPKYPNPNIGLFLNQNDNDWAQNQVLDRLKIVRFYNERALKKIGHSFYQATKYSGQPRIQQVENGRPEISQGFIEMSNVNPISEMTQMIEVQRAYEANQKVVSASDQLLQKSANEIARF